MASAWAVRLVVSRDSSVCWNNADHTTHHRLQTDHATLCRDIFHALDQRNFYQQTNKCEWASDGEGNNSNNNNKTINKGRSRPLLLALHKLNVLYRPCKPCNPLCHAKSTPNNVGLLEEGQALNRHEKKTTSKGTVHVRSVRGRLLSNPSLLAVFFFYPTLSLPIFEMTLLHILCGWYILCDFGWASHFFECFTCSCRGWSSF